MKNTHPYKKILSSIILILCISVSSAHADLDAAANGPIYGESAGIERVQQLENELHQMTIKSSHPRIHLTPDLIAHGRAMVMANHPSWSRIRASADGGNLINSAFAYQMLKDSNPSQASAYATNVVNAIKNGTASKWGPGFHRPQDNDRKVAEWALGFDWVYDAISPADRSILINKIAQYANFTDYENWYNGGGKIQGETFHREEWIFYNWNAWPMLALAGHHPDAAPLYKMFWNYDFYYGDAARAYAYLKDGTYLEGYQYGASGIGWFKDLYSATGINLIDDPRWPYFREATDYQLYTMDFGRNRNIFHHGVAVHAAGCWTYTDTTGSNRNWKLQDYHARGYAEFAPKNPYYQYSLINQCKADTRGVSSWIISQEYYNKWRDFENISTLLYYNPTAPSKNPQTATYSELPFDKLFDTGHEAIMRSSWGPDAAMMCFRSTPALSKTSHGDFDTNTILFYRKGVLAPDSGVYDYIWGQTNLRQYQQNTTAHNDLIVIDPDNRNAPGKLSGSKDPGGVDFVTTRTFGFDYGFGENAVFLHNPGAEAGDIIAFESHPEYSYAVGDSTTAYKSRVDEFTRQVVFIRRPDNKAYVVVFDRVNTLDSKYLKRWLLHLPEEPTINGSITNTEVAGHIVNYDGDEVSSPNVFNNSALYLKVLLPADHNIRKIGGEGYRFWVEGTTPQNWPIPWDEVEADFSETSGAPLAEIGQWRIEISPNVQRQRDYFLNVIYLGDTGETLAPINLIDDAGNYGCIISDSTDTIEIKFNKLGDTGGHIKIMNGGTTTIDKALTTTVEIPGSNIPSIPRILSITIE